MPVAPSIVMTPPAPARASSSAARTVAISSSRPRNGSRDSAVASSAVPSSSPTSYTSSGTALPFIGNGPAGLTANRVRECSRTAGCAKSTPAGALDMIRAAVFVVSPMPEYAPRSGIPTSAANTCPRLTPSCSGSGESESAIRRSARSIRPSSSSNEVGMPGAEEELAAVAVEVGGQQADRLGGQRLLDQADGPVQRLGQDVRARARQQGVGAGELDERDAGDPVLGVGDARVEVLAQLVREQPADPLAVDVREDELVAGRRVRRAPAQQQLAVLARPDGVGGQPGRGRRR